MGAVGFWDNVAFDEVANMKIKDADTIQIMKDYMANGRFSRGQEVTGQASFAFVGNFDLNIPSIVNSYDHDLLATLPKAFDFAVIDRFYNYIPGWEIPKIDDSAYNNNYGMISDYLSEILHYLFDHNSNYLPVLNKYLKVGDNVEGRDSRALQKTVLGFLKLIYPVGEPTPEEFDDIVAYALEGRRRVKEQLNKRKPDEEYARINMSYVNKDGKKVVVWCPESKDSMATQDPRKTGDVEIAEEPQAPAARPTQAINISAEEHPVENLQPSTPAENDIVSEAITDNGPKPKTLSIRYGDTGYSYDKLFAEYLEGAKSIELQEPYLSHGYQLQNLTRFAETIAKIGDCKKITLTTKMGDTIDDTKRIQDGLEQLKAALQDIDIDFEFTFSDLIHARYIITDNGWNISLDRGLHIYQNIGRNFYLMGYYDLDLRPCLETKIVYTKVD